MTGLIAHTARDGDGTERASWSFNGATLGTSQISGREGAFLATVRGPGGGGEPVRYEDTSMDGARGQVRRDMEARAAKFGFTGREERKARRQAVRTHYEAPVSAPVAPAAEESGED